MLTPKELYDKYEYLVPITVGKNFPSETYREAHMLDLDDIYQFGRIGLYEACQKYDVKRGKSFRNFAIDSIIWKIKNESKKYSLRSINTYSNELVDNVSLNTVVSDSSGAECYLQDTIEENVDLIENLHEEFKLQELKENSSSNLYKTVIMRIQGYTFEEIADDLGITKQRVHSLLNRNKGNIMDLLGLSK